MKQKRHKRKSHVLCCCLGSLALNLNSFDWNIKSQEIQATRNSASFLANIVALCNSWKTTFLCVCHLILFYHLRVANHLSTVANCSFASCWTKMGDKFNFLRTFWSTSYVCSRQAHSHWSSRICYCLSAVGALGSVSWQCTEIIIAIWNCSLKLFKLKGNDGLTYHEFLYLISWNN